jgi:hypothetical protein
VFSEHLGRRRLVGNRSIDDGVIKKAEAFALALQVNGFGGAAAKIDGHDVIVPFGSAAYKRQFHTAAC